ncbi:hypothetical protein [uncultured Croceicoccus sp.]|uniref:hypothetical protein n=1 Tax=uncultured Croceicoccus sp. TaxID=1295329 RepID=UPI00262D5373|nr:hypothetical protein [uncultured Croceicoccus sp.]
MPGDSFIDEPHIQRIEKALWSREPSGTAAVLVGAGFSRNAVAARAIAGSMPGWNEIYSEMVSQLYPANVPASARTRQWLLQQTGSTSAYLRMELSVGCKPLSVLQNAPFPGYSSGHEVLPLSQCS